MKIFLIFLPIFLFSSNKINSVCLKHGLSFNKKYEIFLLTKSINSKKNTFKNCIAILNLCNKEEQKFVLKDIKCDIFK